MIIRLGWMPRVICALSCIAAGGFFANRAAADSFDWRNVNGQNWNSTVKNQFGGTCWDFSACGVLEAKYKLTRNDSTFNIDVSEQQICWETNPDMGSTSGGWGSSVLAYFTSHGVVSEAECPHQTSSEDAGIAPYWPLAAGWENRVWKSVSNGSVSNDTNVMKQYLKANGPLEVGISAGNDLFDSPAAIKANYRGPVWGLDHEVVLVGYYDDPTMPTGGYWVIKNSWDTGYADNGYGYIPYGNIEIHNDVSALTGGVYYTGTMASATWKGGAAAWSSGGNNWTNDANGNAYAWENKETAATFGGSGAPVTINGSVIAHSLTINAGSVGYSFSGGSLTVTAGGITANEDVAFSSPLFIGGPQAWNVAAGKNLTVTGLLHTVISDLTFNGAGNTTIAGAIDGGGVANLYAGAKPGGLIQAGAGTLTFTGASNFGGDITVQTGSGGLTIAPAGGAATSYSGAFFGGGSIVVNSPGTVSIGGGSSNFTGAISLQGGGTLAFIPASGTAGTFSGAIDGASTVAHNGAGTTILSGSNTYSGATTINRGALQADLGKGIPSASLLVLNGGVYQNDTATSFTLNLGTSGNTFQWAAGGGGFAAGTKALSVNIGNAVTPITLVWGSNPDDVGAKIVGPLKFGSSTSTKAVTFINSIDLNGAGRTIQVDDNPNSTSDYAVISGAITGSAGIAKTGAGLLKLTGANSYTGTTTISGGQLQAAFDVGVPSANFLCLDGGVFQFVSDASFTRSLGTSGQTFQWTANGGGFSAGSNPLTVNVFNDGRTLTWGNTTGSQLAGPLKLNAATAGNSLTFVNGIDLHGGARTLSVDANTVYLTGALGDTTGGGSLTKTGVGALYLKGDAGNTYTGSTTILGGNLTLAKTSGYAIPGDLTLGGSTSYTVSVQGNNQIAPTAKIVWNATSGTQDLNLYQHDLTVTSLSDNAGRGYIESYTTQYSQYAPTITVNNAADCTFGGSMSGSMSIVKTGTGTFTLAGGNVNYYGPTTVSQGKLVLKDVTGFSVLSSKITDNSVLEFNQVSSLTMMSGVIEGSGSVIKNGGNKLVIYGSGDNTYKGTTTVLNGTLVLQRDSGYAIPGNLTITDGGSFVIVQNPNQFPASTVLTLSGGWDAHFEAYGNTITVAGIVSTGDGGAIENTEGETGVGNSTLIVNNAANCTYGGAIRDTWGGSGTIALVKDGPGTLTLRNARSGDYTGGLTVKNGTLNYSIGALPKCNYTITGGLLNIGGLSQTIGDFQIAGGTLSGSGTLTSNTIFDIQSGTVSARLSGTAVLNKTGSGLAMLTGLNNYSGATTISGGALQANDPISLSNSSYLVLDGGVLQNNYSTQFTRPLSATAGANAFQWTLSGGGFSAGNGLLTVRIGGSNAAVNWGDAAGANIAGMLVLNSPTAANLVDFQNGIKLNGKIRTIYVDDNAASNADAAKISGIIANGSGSGGIIKTGPGLLTLTNLNTFTGGTTVSAGILATANAYVLGAVGSSVTVQAGAQLQLGATLPLQASAVLTNQGTITGTISLSGGAKALGNGVFGPVSLQTNGTFSPGNAVGLATTGTATWGAAGKFLFEINDALGNPGTNWDLWNIAGDLAITGSQSSSFCIGISSLNDSSQAGPMADFNPATNYSWLLASVTGTITGFNADAFYVDTSLVGNDVSKGTFSLTESGDAKQIYLNYSPIPVPEPSTLIPLIGAALVGLLSRQRMRR